MKSDNDAVIMCRLSKFPITFAGTEFQDSCLYRAYATKAGGTTYCQNIVKRNNFTSTVAVI